jgi:PAS domain-containing protein
LDVPGSSRKFIVGIAAILVAGGLIGWIYGHAAWGLLIAALIILVWQTRQLLNFNRALHTRDFEQFRYGEGIWQQMFSRYNYENQRAVRAKREYRRLLKEIRRSTDAMPDGAVILDETNQIIMCNKAAKRLGGLKRKKDRGQRVDNILRDKSVRAGNRNRIAGQGRMLAELQGGAVRRKPEAPYFEGRYRAHSADQDASRLHCQCVPRTAVAVDRNQWLPGQLVGGVGAAGKLGSAYPPDATAGAPDEHGSD